MSVTLHSCKGDRLILWTWYVIFSILHYKTFSLLIPLLQKKLTYFSSINPPIKTCNHYVGIIGITLELCSSVSTAAEEETGGGTQCFAEGGGGIAHHAGQLWADSEGTPEPAWSGWDESVWWDKIPSGNWLLSPSECRIWVDLYCMSGSQVLGHKGWAQPCLPSLRGHLLPSETPNFT